MELFHYNLQSVLVDVTVKPGYILRNDLSVYMCIYTCVCVCVCVCVVYVCEYIML